MPSGERTLLLVEDEPAIVSGLAALLRRRGFVVQTAATALAAMAVLQRQHVDGMLVDFRLPDMRGDVLYAAAAALQPHLARRTVFLTGDISTVASESLEDTHCPIMLKPFDLADLERVIVETIGGPVMIDDEAVGGL